MPEYEHPPSPEAPGAIHPPIPFGLGSQITLTGGVGAIAAFIIAWVQDGLTAETVTLGAIAGGVIATFFAGRSVQAKAAIEKGTALLGVATGEYEKGTTPPDEPLSSTAEARAQETGS